MEINTVVISIEEYDKLRKFKEETELALRNEKKAVLHYKYGAELFGSFSIGYCTDDDMVLKLTNEIKELQKDIEEKDCTIKLLVNSENQLKEYQRMNVFEFALHKITKLF